MSLADLIEQHCQQVWPRCWHMQPEHVKDWWRETYRIVFEAHHKAEGMRP